MGSCASIQTSEINAEAMEKGLVRSSVIEESGADMIEQIKHLQEKLESEQRHNTALRLQLDTLNKNMEDWKLQNMDQFKHLQNMFSETRAQAAAQAAEARGREEALVNEHQLLISSALRPTLIRSVADCGQYDQISAPSNYPFSTRSGNKEQTSNKSSLSRMFTQSVELFLQRQNSDYVRRVFEDCGTKRSANGMKAATNEEVQKALQQLGINHLTLGIEDLVAALDLDHDHVMNYEEFALALQFPSKIERWTSSIPWSQMIAAILNSMEEIATDTDPLYRLTKLYDDEDKLAIIFEGISFGVQRLLKDRLLELKQALKELQTQSVGRNRNRSSESSDSAGTDDNKKKVNKFSAAQDMECGIVSDFYDGLNNRIGKSTIVVPIISPFSLFLFDRYPKS